MKTSPRSTARGWTRLLDLSVLIAVGGVLAVLLLIELMSRGGMLQAVAPSSAFDEFKASAQAPWVQQRELSALCGSAPDRARLPDCEAAMVVTQAPTQSAP